jgi:serine/threonine protein kinase
MSGLMQLGVGSVFAEDYRIVRPLGEGGMGAVYVAEQLSTGKQRALKIMRSALVTNELLRQRFAQEAKLGALVDSDHAVEVVAAGVDPSSGIPWLAMELLKGETLAERIGRGGPLGVAEVAEVIAQLCHALSAAHAAGIVHRDLKLENVFLAVPRREGAPFVVKILDFGIAKLVAESQTSTTAAIGTPLWMAPEQSEPGGAIQPATDVWALGLIVFFLLTGRCYWRGANEQNASAMTLLREVVFDPLASASERAAWLGVAERLPPRFDDWFACCVARDASARFPHAGAAHAALARALDAAPASSPRAAPALGSAATVPIDSSAPFARRAPPAQHAEAAPLAATRSAALAGPQSSTTGALLRAPRATGSAPRPARPGVAVGIGAGVLAIGGLVAFAALRARPPAPRLDRAASAEAPSQAPSRADARMEPRLEGSRPSDLDAPRGPSAPSPESASTPPPEVSARPPSTPAATSAAPIGTGEFDRRAAKASLAAVAYKDCGGVGQGKLDVTFAPNGTVTAVSVVAGDYVAATRSCIADRFRKATIPPFSGDAHTVGWRIYAF